MTALPDTPNPNPGVSTADVLGEEAGYHKGLRPRQLQMIGIGGAIGTGLFLGAGGRLANAGPGLFLVYAICGLFVFLILRALGELVLHRPSSGSFVSYAREFFGEKAAYAVGWMYFLNWAMTSIVDTTAIATYLHRWTIFTVLPQWTLALIALAVVLAMNLISVEWFGELEFWAALVKVCALLAFLIVGTIFLAGRYPVDGHSTGLSLWTSHSGLFPTGVAPLLVLSSGVAFAYGAVELVGTAAGETAEPEKIMPRAINSVIARIAIFYVGSVILLALLLPYTAYTAHESPFVTFFSKIGFHGAGDLMNIVVLTAALSSLNAGLYSTGRVMHSIAINGSGPKFTAKMSKNGVPYGGILLTAVICLFGVALNAFNPGQAFEIVLNIAVLGIIASWATIVLCQLRLHKMAKAGIMRRPRFRMPLAPHTGYLTLAFLAAILVLMAFDKPIGTWTVASLVVIVPALIAGWYLVRQRVMAVARERMGYTGPFPAIANPPVQPPGRSHSQSP
ncbi:amino acid permease [Mycobacterium haemophilum]|uniref:L-asparagine permease n=1 Tax=Mycobacterium haemophilum TaxID=29311 RepID=A0A0I9U1H0_9MYCO|nr:amino acid permease [Mycobacterium haemophilum]KLO26440.1 L-asparagine permease [Mycobacterium haemophilum]KLO34660.1 L-asparagine permease [Mycobacterium haemophilum]KLO39625.1 L-asparagine permease [Mycobacterium haemophilum]KLO46556.1 L-asparagine permease [Mycobacterium haemophilum]